MTNFLVTGATGNVGRFLCETLLAQGHGVHALSRDPSSTSAQTLSSLGVVFFRGSFEDEAALQAAAKGCSGVFLNPSPSFTDGDMERRHAKSVIDASIRAGVKACVYMSVVGAGTQDAWPAWALEGMMAPYWLGKHAIQELVKDAGFEHWSIFQPPTFMTNYSHAFVRVMHPEIQEEPVGIVKSHNDPQTKLSLVDPKDIAEITAVALLEPARFDKKTLLIRSDVKAMDEIVQALSKASGKELRTSYSTAEEKDRDRATLPWIEIARWVDEIEPRFEWVPQDQFGIAFTSFEKHVEREKQAAAAAVRKPAD